MTEARGNERGFQSEERCANVTNRGTSGKQRRIKKEEEVREWRQGEGGKKKMERVLLRGWRVATANKKWHNERMRMGTIREDILIQWF